MIIGFVVIAINRDQLLQRCHRFFDLVRIEVVARNHRLVLRWPLSIGLAVTDANNFAQQIHESPGSSSTARCN